MDIKIVKNYTAATVETQVNYAGFLFLQAGASAVMGHLQ